VVCDNVTNAPNIGSLFRISDAFGIEKLIICGANITLGRRISKTSRATEKVVNYEIHESALEVIEALKSLNYQIIALEITNKSNPIHAFNFSLETPIVFVIGDENFGVSEDILKLSDAIIHIDMFGQNSSMNVVQAANIALYEITKQLI
jgi:tRNA G18 (ribose-2'-O)-methylase SpoU